MKSGTKSSNWQEALLEHDEFFFSLWRSHHIKMVERMVGAKRGTGGSEGIGYLRTTLDKKFFPELWEARTYLDVKHGEGGCPFRLYSGTAEVERRQNSRNGYEIIEITRIKTFKDSESDAASSYHAKIRSCQVRGFDHRNGPIY